MSRGQDTWLLIRMMQGIQSQFWSFPFHRSFHLQFKPFLVRFLLIEFS